MFHDQVQSYLRAIASPGSTRKVDSNRLDVAALRKLLLARLKQLPPNQDINSLHQTWSGRLQGLADFLQRELPPPTTANEVRKVARRIFETALSIPGAKVKNSVEALEARRLLKTFEWEGYDLARYALENRLTRLNDRLELERTLLATTLLRLSGREAIRWLLIIESERSTGPGDGWSVHRDVLRDLLGGIEEQFNSSGDSYFPWSQKTLSRLERMGVADARDEIGSRYQAAPSMRDLVTECLADDPWRAAVRAALADETQRVVAVAHGTNLEATTELSRIVAHEVRNALVPVRHHATTLLGGTTESSDRDRVEKVLRGVNRVLRFVEELVTISEAVTPERLETRLTVFLQEAIGPLEGGAERVILECADQLLELPREPLARALRNVVQNALQITKSPVPVDVRGSAHEGVLTIQVDDGGPGVPPELLFKVTPGFESVTTRLRTVSEEIDISVRNDATVGVWSKEGPYVLAECKNWSGKVGAPEYATFREKLASKFNRARVGFFFSIGGFTKGFEEKLVQDRKGDVLIVAVDADGIQRWIDSPNRLSHLEDLHQRATLGG